VRLDQDSREQSEFNMAVSYLNRINFIFYICNDAAKNLDMSAWWHGLLNLQREISTEMNEEDEKKINEFFIKIEPLISKYHLDRKNGMSKELYFAMHNFEMYLRKILKSSGLQMKVKEDLLTPEEDW